MYYSYEPFSNSLLEDFAAASREAKRTGDHAMAFGLSIIGLCTMIFTVQRRLDGQDSESEKDTDETDPADESDVFSILPRN